MKTAMKLIALILVFAMALCVFAGCAKSETDTTPTEAKKDDTPATTEAVQADDSDSAYVLDKGTLVIGITDFAPMDYMEAGEWVGFDADMANAFAAYLGVEAQFVEIVWETKTMELDNKNIDCVWNGMTLTDAVKTAMETSNAYCNNAQVVVVRSDVAAQYQDIDSIRDLKFVVEAGSAGAEQLDALNIPYIEADSQADALMEVAAGTSEACVIDLLMAGAMIGEGTSYADLTYTVALNSEEYGVGFRKGSDLAAKLNEFFAAAYKDGSMLAIAEKYGVQESLIAQ
ncbi:MAG: transporter substrate-binding domain-containing protein [Oscillospiraceae bacterium]|nr:transporter substrate-binding domain-containing protein [Oscillospiraceae bacterium]